MRNVFLVMTAAAITAHAGFASAAPIIDRWEFTYADDTGLAAAVSNNGTSLGNNSDGLVSVQGNALQFSSTNTDGSTSNLSSFRTAELSTNPITASTNSGIVEVAWTITSADFTNTAAAGGSGRQGFFLRDNDPSNSDAGARLIFDGSGFVIEYSDSNNNNTATAGVFAGSTLNDVDIRYVADYTAAGDAGSFQLFYSVGGGPEIALVTDGTITLGDQVDQLRTVQQVTNGGTDWRAGDTLTVDNLQVQFIPEPASLALIGLGSMTMLGRRRA